MKSNNVRSAFLWTALGSGLPLIAAVIAIPNLIVAMGMARFGVLSLAWVIVGYFSFFDFGLGRAMTQLVARKIGSGQVAQLPALVRTGMSMMVVLGLVGAVLIGAISPWLVHGPLKIPSDLRDETLTAFFILASSIPLVIATTALRGILEALQRFDVVNIVRAPLGLLTYFGPLAVLPFSNQLPDIVGVLVVARLVSMLVYLVAGLWLYPELGRKAPVDRRIVRDLLSFGGWMTVSNITAPLLLYAGRLAVAVGVSVEAVGYFSTPYDVVINLLLVPSVFVSVLFPMFAQQFPTGSVDVRRLYRRSLWQMTAVMLPACVLTWLLARPALAWWINLEFAQQSYQVAQWLAVGIFINSFGHVSQSLVQAYGRPDFTAKLHLAELLLYLPYMWWMILQYGVVGAAIAWVIRVAISTAVLAVMADRCLADKIRKFE
jgi:O-antigen/teichoic acid export membrane protein